MMRSAYQALKISVSPRFVPLSVMVREFIPSSDTGHVLLTTRAQSVGILAASSTIETMEPEEGALFLLHRLKKLRDSEPLESVAIELRKQAEALAKAVDGLPLAIDQAAAFIEEMHSTLEEYLNLYRKERANLLAHRSKLGDDHPSVTVTFSLAFKKVEEASPAAADLLRLCAFLDADAIPEEIFSRGGQELGERLGEIAANRYMLNEVIGEAGHYSLLRRNPETRTVSLHRVAQAVLRDEMEDHEERMWAKRAVRAVNSAFPEVEFENWDLCSRLALHAQVLALQLDEFDFEFPEAARMMNQAGEYLNEHGQYVEAEPLFRRALVIREKVFGAEHPDVAISLNNLAALYKNQDRFAEVEPLYLRALAIREKVLGAEHPDVAISLNNLAALYKNQGDYGKAEPLYLRALSIREKTLDPGHASIASSLSNLAMLYDKQGRLAEAEPLYKRALAIYGQASGPEYSPSPRPVRVFVSSSYKDESLVSELETHLNALRKAGVIADWSDRHIPMGIDWRREIRTAFEAADLILILVSSDFLASDNVYDVEVRHAIQKNEEGKARVVPIILRPVDWRDTPFAIFQALPRGAKPVTSWRNRDEAWVDVVEGIRLICDEIRALPKSLGKVPVLRQNYILL